MAAPPFVAARVTPEMKTLLRTLAEREQITESALVRQLLEVTLRRSAMEGFPKLHVLEKASRDARLSVRLRHEDRTLLSARATARGGAAGLEAFHRGAQGSRAKPQSDGQGAEPGCASHSSGPARGERDDQ